MNRFSVRALSQGVLAILFACAFSVCSFSQTTEATNTKNSSLDRSLRGQVEEIEHSAYSLKTIPQAAISPDGTRFAYLVAFSGEVSKQELFVGYTANPDSSSRVDVSGPKRSHKGCRDSDPAWSPDGLQLAFLSDCASPSQPQLFLANFKSARSPDSTPRRITNLIGYLSRPAWSSDGKAIALLFVDHASRAPSPLAAGNPQTGVIDDLQQLESQRIALVDLASGKVRSLTPPTLTVFEFDWAPNGQRIAYTAAPPPGDDNWYIAQLYTQSLSEAEGHSIFKPEFQIALPRWSPDGKNVAFIAGLMSDEGATGGEIYVLPSEGGQPSNLTPDRRSSPVWFQFKSPDLILFSEYRGGSVALSTLDLSTGKIDTKWEAGESIHASPDDSSLAVASGSADASLVVRESWTQPAELFIGPVGKWTQLTHLNHAVDDIAPSRFEDMKWQNAGLEVEGWLLFPQNYDPAKKYPMLVSIHGGPAWIKVPSVGSMDFQITSFTHLGYFIFLPNPRGSFGQGEKFTRANQRDFGFGDVSDVVSGVDAVAAKYSVDRQRVGIIGWSYGASTAMMAVGQSNHFRAAVAGAGASNLLSYYGENQIDKWMRFYYGVSAYDDPAAYMRSSAISYVKQVKAPTLLVVGERDEEAPPLQSFEFWHALKELGTPTQLVVYPEEGHSFEKYKNRVDLVERAASWFAKYMPAPTAESDHAH